MNPKTPCQHCPHTKDQHDEDGFCEQVKPGHQDFCECTGFEEKDPEEPTE